MMLPESKWKQFGRPNMEAKGIVIHNTNINRSAKECEQMMSESTDSKGTHFFVDSEVIQMMPTSWSVWNTGKGLDFGNLNCIAIEICSNLNSEIYLQNEQNAVKLIKELMEKYGLTTDDIYFHRDFDNTVNCPAQILKRYTRNQFINLLKEEQR